jgi:F-type H+-transporting ATPase subunit epsilon
MRLRIFLPSELFLDEDVTKVVAESPFGGFTLLPRHIDLTTALAPGILAYEAAAGARKYVAINEGILVKQGEEVMISTRTAVAGELGGLRERVEEFLTDIDEKERKARSAVARLEADFIRRFVEFGKNA